MKDEWHDKPIYFTVIRATDLTDYNIYYIK